MIFERVMKNLADGLGRRGDDLGNCMATILPSGPSTWWENMKPSILSVPFRKCACTKCCFLCVLLPWCPLWHKPGQGKYNMPVVICPFHLWSMGKFSTDLFSSTVAMGTFSCTSIFTQGFRVSYHYYDGCMSMEAWGAAQVSGVWHRSLGYSTWPIYSAFWSSWWKNSRHYWLYHLPLEKAKFHLFPILLPFLWGDAEKLGNIYLWFMWSHIIYRKIICQDQFFLLIS